MESIFMNDQQTGAAQHGFGIARNVETLIGRRANILPQRAFFSSSRAEVKSVSAIHDGPSIGCFFGGGT